MSPTSFDPAPFSARRQTLLKQLGDGVALIPTAPERVRNRDSLYPYRFDSYFWYLTGFPEPEAALVLVGGETPRTLLFCREKNVEREIWDGFRYGPATACEAFGVDEAYPIDELEQRLPELIADRAVLWHALGHDPDWDRKITGALGTVRTQSRAGKRAPAQIRDPRELLDRLRLIKDAHELDCLRRAADIASAGHARAMRTCRPGLPEYALEAELIYEFRRQGASGHSFPPIVAGGASACVLHYVNNDKILAEGTLVLVDAGCEFAGYAADITRTYPVSGHFSAAQRDVYEVVLAAQQAAVAAIAPGVPFIAYHEAALRVLVQGMVDLGLLGGEVDGLIESEAYKPFYMHRTGHWLGLDVHDAGDYKTDGEWTLLATGMTLTVEPGLYIAPGSDAPAPLQGIGIRIEDDVLVTAAGAEVYTSAPRSVAAIEEAMRSE